MGEKEKEKVTIMILKVDLQCEKCYRKVKKVLCKFPQIRDQTYDEKNNQVIIKVVCCSPEKIRDRLCCKGGGTIKSIDIKEPEVPEPKTAPAPPPEEKGVAIIKSVDIAEPEEPKKKPPPPPTEDDVVKKPITTKTVKDPALSPELTESALTTALVPAYPAYTPTPTYACCMDFYGGHPGGPCQTDYGYGVPAAYVQYDGYYGRPVYDSYSDGSSYNTCNYCVTRPDYFSEDNPQSCIIM